MENFFSWKWRYFRIKHWFCLLWRKWVWYYSHDYRPNWTPLNPITSTMTNCSQNHVITSTNCSSFRFALMYDLNKNPNSTLKRRRRFILLIVCSIFTSPKTNKQTNKQTEKKKDREQIQSMLTEKRSSNFIVNWFRKFANDSYSFFITRKKSNPP